MNIQVQDISKIYGAGESQVTALNHASMTIHSGDFISIIGPSGSGKSTLLHIVSGLDKPTSGSVYYGDTDIHNGSDKQLSAFRRQKIGFIFQQFNLLPVLTARENIIMPLLLDKKQPDEKYLKQLTELLGLEERLSHLPHELSGGVIFLITAIVIIALSMLRVNTLNIILTLIQGIFAIYETMSAKSELSDYGSMVQYGAGFYLLLIGGIVAFVGAIIGLVLHINAKKAFNQA